VGTIRYPDFSQLRVADVPGIIEGASAGVGLGIDFLKHLARSRVLVYVVDMAGTDNRRPWDDYFTLRREIEQHDADLLERPRMVLANKMDQDAAVKNLPRFVRETGVTPLQLSALDPSHPGVAEFKRHLWELLRPLPKGAWQPVPVEGACHPAGQVANLSHGQRPAQDAEVAGSAPAAEILHESALARAPFLDLSRKPSRKKKR
jgi:GTP-binding protein